MSDKAVVVVLLYMAFAFGFGVLIGKGIALKDKGYDDD